MFAPLLVVGHPGHELMVHGWLENAHPRVCVLTDGSGRTGMSRVGSSEKIVHNAGAHKGSVWGALSDMAVYRALLDRRTEIFVDLVLRISDEIANAPPPFVVADAREGFNPTHDLCSVIAGAAVRRAERAGVAVASYSFALCTPHNRSPRQGSIVRELSDGEHARKLCAARAYPELSAEVDAVFRGEGPALIEPRASLHGLEPIASGMTADDLRTECLFPTPPSPPSADVRPFYEIYGERLAALGIYERPIRYVEHVRPIELAIAEL